MDGVLWRDHTPIGNLPSIFAEIRRRGLKVTLATNNATLSTDQYLQKLAGFGVTLNAEQIVNSPQATAHYLHQRFPQGGPVFVVGEDGLANELAEKGFYNDDQPDLPPSGVEPLAVVVGLDRGITYQKLKKASLLVRAGTPFIATNTDKTLPTPEGQAPGAGAIVASIEAATDVHPLVIGKPEPAMYRLALARMQLLPEQVLVVGDRLETDIVGAQRINCRTGLVLSGISTLEQGEAWKPALDCIAEELSRLLGLK